jgi:hypothetical protein
VGSILPDGWLLTLKLRAVLSVVPTKSVPSTVPAFPVNDQPPALGMLPRFTQELPLLYHTELVVVSYTSIPWLLGVATIDNLPIESISGSCTPWVPDTIDKMTFGLGTVVGFVALITTVCAYPTKTENRKPAKSKKNFIV